MEKRCNQTENLIVFVEKYPNASNITVHDRILCNYFHFNTTYSVQWECIKELIDMKFAHAPSRIFLLAILNS